jgi:hypothetical protein
MYPRYNLSPYTGLFPQMDQQRILSCRARRVVLPLACYGPGLASRPDPSRYLTPASVKPRYMSSVGKVRFGPVLSQLLLNAEPDPRFGSGSFPER